MARILIGNIKGPKGDIGIQGPQGEIGPQGPEGPLPPLANNGLTTEPGFALDARYGKTLKEFYDGLNSNLVKTHLFTLDITTQTAAGVALGAYAYQQIITSNGALAGKTILGACVESVKNKALESEVGIGAIDTSNGYVYINTIREGIYSVRVRVYYK